MQSFLLKVFRKIRLTPEKPERNPVTFQDFAVGGVTQQILQRNPAFFDFFCTFAVLVYGAQGIRKADGRIQHAPPVVPFGSADVDLKSVVRSGGENIIARFFFLKTGFSVRYGDIVSTASCAQRLKGGGTDGGLVFTQDFFGFCFCFGSVQDRLQFFGNGIAYLKLDLLVGGAVAVGSYVKAHDLCSDFLLQTGLAENWRFRKGSAPQCRRGASGGRKFEMPPGIDFYTGSQMYFGAAPACPWISSVSDFDSVSGSVLFSHSYAASCFFQFCRISKLLYTDTHCPLRYSIHFKPFTALSESTECSFRFPTHSTSPPVSPPLFFSPGCHKFRTGTHRQTPPVFRSAP